VAWYTEVEFPLSYTIPLPTIISVLRN